VTFTAQLYGGTGANGLTLALLDPAHATATSVGGNSSALGLGGLGGTAVALSTVKVNKFSTGNMAEICASTAGTVTLAVLQRAEAIPPLRGGPATVTVAVSRPGGSYVLTVWVDGAQVLQQAAPGLTATSLLAFTASTGTRTDVHLVRDVAIAAAG
jgi:hypothetical protein